MIGFDEAAKWLADNAPDWVIHRVETTLRAGAAAAAPTELRTQVVLIPTARAPRSDLSLLGEGSSMLEAVQNAVGGLRKAIKILEKDAARASESGTRH
jgi:hypothetical protein